jgi:hypothetical protein
MPDKTASAVEMQKAAELFTTDLVKMSRELAIAEIQRFYAATEPIRFSAQASINAGELSRTR